MFISSAEIAQFQRRHLSKGSQFERRSQASEMFELLSHFHHADFTKLVPVEETNYVW